MSHRISHVVRHILPADLPTARDLLTGESSPMTDQELLDIGIARLPEPDHYSCVEQTRRDDALFIAMGKIQWASHGPEIPGRLITQGPNRYAQLPDDLKPKILLARVIRSTLDGETAVSTVRASLADQVAAINEFVGPIEGAEQSEDQRVVRPLVDLSGDTADVDEARRLVSVPESGLEVAHVTMAEIDPESHLVDQDSIEPHRWAGERTW